MITGNNKTDETRGDTGGQADKVKQEIIEKKCKFDTEKNTETENGQTGRQKCKRDLLNIRDARENT